MALCAVTPARASVPLDAPAAVSGGGHAAVGPDDEAGAEQLAQAPDGRVADNQPLLAFSENSLMLPEEKSLWPKREAPERRIAHWLEG